MAAVMASGIFGHSAFARGWPIELLLTGMLLCVIMTATSVIWILIPAGLLVGNGILFSYYSITGWWQMWSFFWPLEPLLIAGVVAVTIALARLGERSRQLAEWLGLAIGLLALMCSIPVAFLSLIV
jgi:hypothetical protein